MQYFGISNLRSQNTTSVQNIDSGDRSSWTLLCPSGFKLRFLCVCPIEKKENTGAWASPVKNIDNVLVSSAFQTRDQPGTFKCLRARCKTCPFICNVEKLSGPKRSIKITDHFTCTSANAIYCSTCTLCKKLFIGETGRRQGDRFREHLRDVDKDDKNSSKPAARYFNLPNHSKQHMAVCSLSLHQRSTESRKTLEQRFIFQIALLILTVSTNAFHSTYLFCCFLRY